jgi:tetratricopeptide (TPR) repeat protein
VPIDRPAILRNAEKLLRQGKLDQAIGEYLRIVEDQPSDWNTANVLGDLYVRAGQTDRAVEQFVRIADHLHVEGFLPKAAAVYKKVLKLKADHEHATLQAGEIAGKQGLAADARALLNAVAGRRRARGDERGVAEIVVRLATLDPNDFEARLTGAQTRVTLDDLPGAIADLKALAAYMQDKERADETLQALETASALDPDDADLRAQLVEILVARGELDRARALAPVAPDVEPLESQPLLTTAAEYLRAGNPVEGLEMLRRVVAEDLGRSDEIALLGCSLAESDPELGLEVVQLAADATLAAGDHASAAAALQEYVTRVPTHVPALVRLIAVCEGGGLEATLHTSRAQLADAYIAAGQGDEARAIAEDLIAREPWERANVERFRRALVLLGEPDPDDVIASRLSGHKPFTSTDGTQTEVPVPVAPTPPAPPESSEAAPAAVAPVAAARTPASSVDLGRIFDEVAVKPATTGRAGEIDLSVALNEIRRPASSEAPKPSETPLGRLPVAGSRNAPDEDYRLGLALYEEGRVDEAIAPLEAASRAPKLRFLTASVLGRICRARGNVAEAIEWFERAAQAPAPTPEQGHLLLFDLAEALEGAGETARALAICMELQADAGNYRDVAARIDRLAKVRARG